PIGSAAEAGAAVAPTPQAAALARSNLHTRMFVSPYSTPFMSGPPQTATPPLFGSPLTAETPERAQVCEESLSALRLIHVHIKYDRDQEYKALHGAHPGAGEAGGDKARFNHPDDEASEDSADNRRLAAEDRGSPDQHRGDRGQQISLSLIAEEILVLERQH